MIVSSPLRVGGIEQDLLRFALLGAMDRYRSETPSPAEIALAFLGLAAERAVPGTTLACFQGA